MRAFAAFRMVIHDRTSTAGALLGVVAIVFLVGQQLSILFGLLNYMSVLPDHSRADAWVMSENVRNVDAADFISGRYIDRIIGLESVEWAEPVLIGYSLFHTLDKSNEFVQIVGTQRPLIALGPWEFEESDKNSLLDEDSITVDRLDLEKLGNPKVGDITEIGGNRVRIGAITSGARGFQGTIAFTTLDKAKKILRAPAGRYTAILVKFRNKTHLQEKLSGLKKILPKCSVYTSSEIARMTQEYYLIHTGIGGSFGFSTTIGVLVGIVIITLTMYTSVLGRFRDFAVMRAIGGRRIDIAAVVIAEALIIAGCGLFIGFIMLSTLLNLTYNSGVPCYFPSYLAPILTGVTFLVSFIGSLIALRVALKAEPASVFH